MFSAKVIEDSVSPRGVRLTTMQISYPRFIHAECKTHRIMKFGTESYELYEDVGFMNDSMLSRNGSSSRAVPIKKFVEQVRANPAMPVHWGKNQPGMQADVENDALIYLKGIGERIPFTREGAWCYAANAMAEVAEAFAEAGYHKQVGNRLLEPFQWMNVIVTATEWSNFFKLRVHEDADPTMDHLAKMMFAAMNASEPTLINYGQWHLPYVSQKEKALYSLETLKKVSTARNARVSYLNHDGSNPDVQKDIELHDMLVLAEPIHASPTEHIATPIPNTALNKNFCGWGQYRIEVENRILFSAK